jgi:hypothetical protein
VLCYEEGSAAKEAEMSIRRAVVLFLVPLVLVAGVPGPLGAQDGISIRIEKHARLTAGGGIAFRVHVTCGPLPGTEDFREGLAGAGQARTGAEAEGGLSPDVVCDGVERLYTAELSPITDAVFRPGPAVARASVIACNTVGDEQVCIQATAQRRVIITGALAG